jgi:hypothetical protein
MAYLIIQENGNPRLTPPVNGEELTIKTPCDCSAVEGVQINNIQFPFYDAAGNSIVDIRNKFSTGSLIRVMIDTVNARAYILNSACSRPSEHTHAASDVTAGTFGGTVVAPTGTDYTTQRIRNAAASMTDLTAGTSALSNGNMYLVYE